MPAPNTPPVSPDYADFAIFHEGYVRHYIGLADTKAGLVFGVTSSLIGFLFSKAAYHELIFNPVCNWHTLIAYVSIILLMLAAGAALAVVAPRMATSGEGIVFFGAVASYQDSDAYLAAVRAKSAADLTDARLRHSYDISSVCLRKYAMLRRSFWLGIIGLLATLPLLSLI